MQTIHHRSPKVAVAPGLSGAGKYRLLLISVKSPPLTNLPQRAWVCVSLNRQWID